MFLWGFYVAWCEVRSTYSYFVSLETKSGVRAQDQEILRQQEIFPYYTQAVSE